MEVIAKLKPGYRLFRPLGVVPHAIWRCR